MKDLNYINIFMKEKILKLRGLGLTYNEIKEKLKCSKATISYYCNSERKEKVKKYTQKIRSKQTPLEKKILSIIYGDSRFSTKSMNRRIEHFSNRNGSKETGKKKKNFKIKDVLDKFSLNPKCYLTGRKIDLYNTKSFEFDHIRPATRKGKNEINNLELAIPEANRAKGNLLLPEFFQLCKEILQYNGYIVKDPE
jgi:hypothetical protein